MLKKFFYISMFLAGVFASIVSVLMFVENIGKDNYGVLKSVCYFLLGIYNVISFSRDLIKLNKEKV